MCGGEVNVIEIKGMTYIGCNCQAKAISKHRIAQVAINNWNASSYSQFTSRISYVPLDITPDIKYEPKEMREVAKALLNDVIVDKDEVLVSALKYVVAWCEWIEINFHVLTKEEMNEEQALFHKTFKGDA